MSRFSLGTLLLLAVAFLCVHAVLSIGLFTNIDAHQRIFHFTIVEVGIYALAVLVVLRDNGDDAAASKRALVFILATAALFRLMLLFAAPVSTDLNRYIWDGRVQSVGINPYLYIPADPALKFLRDGMVFPKINRADYAPTIYPPLAQIVFFLVTRISESLVAMKAAMVGFEIAAVWAILRLLRSRAMPTSRILLYVWHPLPIWEFAGSGHVDAIALACVMLALLAADLKRPFLSGVALGGAALVKFFPVIVGPALYRRWDWRLPLGAVAVVILLYLPYIGAGKSIFGFLGGYSDEEGLRDGSGFYPWVALRHFAVVPQSAVWLYPPLAVAILAVVALVVFVARKTRGADIGGAFFLVATYTVLTSPHFPWYFAWLVPFLCFIPSWPILYLTGSSTLLYIAGWPPSFAGGSVFYGPFFAFLALDVTVHAFQTKEKRHEHAIAR